MRPDVLPGDARQQRTHIPQGMGSGVLRCYMWWWRWWFWLLVAVFACSHCLSPSFSWGYQAREREVGTWGLTGWQGRFTSVYARACHAGSALTTYLGRQHRACDTHERFCPVRAPALSAGTAWLPTAHCGAADCFRGCQPALPLDRTKSFAAYHRRRRWLGRSAEGVAFLMAIPRSC
jgi:hypothetical protein